jgi:hypothetical protein
VRICLLVTVICAACSCGGGNNKTVDAAVVGDGMCAGEDYFTGAMVDWDSGGAFCGVFAATFTVHGDLTRTDTTAPNGRFQLCLAQATSTQIDITPPTATSECAPTVGLYQIAGIAMASHAVIASGAITEWRMIGMNRVTPFYSSFGVTDNDTKATVFVHVSGTPKEVTIDAAHDTTLAFDGTSWAAGDIGQDVVFPNTDASAGTTTVGFSDGSGIGGGTVPVVAHTATYVTLVAN